jgi:ABC-2 type transport system permease protein
MSAVLKNDLYRLLCHKSRIILTLALTAAAIIVAVFFSTKPQVTGNIVFVTQNKSAVITSPYLKITRLDKAPPMSELVSNKYDAYIIFKNDGTYDIKTIKSEPFKQTLLKIMKNPKSVTSNGFNARKIGTNIIGYLLMFVLLEGVVLMYMFSDDKEKKQIVRIAASPLSFTKYLLAHSLFTFGFIFLPTIMILYAIKWVMNINIGFSFVEYLFLLAVISAFATAFSLFINSLAHKSDTANMIGSAVVTLTSVLAGSFYSFENGNKVLENMIKILPQKAYLTFVGGLENKTALVQILPQIIYVILLTAFLFLFAVIKTKRDYVENN